MHQIISSLWVACERLGITGAYTAHRFKGFWCRTEGQNQFSGHNSVSGAMQYERVLEKDMIAVAENLGVSNKVVVKNVGRRSLGMRRPALKSVDNTGSRVNTIISGSRVKISNGKLPINTIVKLGRVGLFTFCGNFCTTLDINSGITS